MSELEAVFYVPLANSQLCTNCEAISSMGRGSHCVCCGSSALQSLSAILNRDAATIDVLESGMEFILEQRSRTQRRMEN